MSAPAAADPSLARLADAVLIPPFPGTSAPAWVLDALGDGLAGVTLFGPNIEDAAQLGALAARLRSAGPEPIIAIDEEGGDVTRIAHRQGSSYPGNAALGAVDDVALTEAVYRALGADLAALGINVDLAPSVDVNTAADNPVIGTRSFGSGTGLVARHAAAAVRGLQAAGVAACAKHFPGHGSTRSDTHHAIALVDGPLAQVIQRDLPPFEAAIAAGVRAVMPGHLRVPELTGDLPASLSAAALTGLLRGELGFTGVIVSDALEMRAVSRPFGIPEAAVLAVAAGTDLLCFGRDQDQLTYLAVRDALVAAVADGRLPGSRLEEAAARVSDLRAWTAARRVTREAARTVARTVARSSGPSGPDGLASPSGDSPVGLAAARRAVRSQGHTGPLTDPVVVEVVPPANIAVGVVPWGLGAWVPPGRLLRIATAPVTSTGGNQPEATGEHRTAGLGSQGGAQEPHAGTQEPHTGPQESHTGTQERNAGTQGPHAGPQEPHPGTQERNAGPQEPHTGTQEPTGEDAAAVLAAAAGRPLVIVVRDAHRYPGARDLVTAVLAARPDAVVVEMGLPVWRPPAGGYLATYGAARTSSRAAAEVLGLARR